MSPQDAGMGRSNVVVLLLLVVMAGAARAAPIPDDLPHASVVVVDALWVLLGNAPRPPRFANESLRDACQANGFTFVRVAGTAFWPNQLKRYIDDRETYLAAVSQLYQIAATQGCKVLLSLAWNWFAVPDVVGEPLGDGMRNVSSLTRAFMVKYAMDVAKQAAAYPSAVAGWELGNEMNLLADLDMQTENPAIAPSLGTPTHRTKADNFSTTDMVEFETWWAAQLVSIATAAGLPSLTSTGHAIPRRDAFHLRASYHQPQRDWGLDTEEEYSEILRYTSSCCDLASVHFYPGAGDRWGVADPNSTHPLAVSMSALKGTNQTLYVGEYGNRGPGPRAFSLAVLAAQRELGIRLSTIWVWEFYQFSGTAMAPDSIGPQADDENIIDAIKHTNSIMKST